jgi:sugar lactone lactonase YvrE
MPDAMDVAVGAEDRLFVLAKRPARVYVFEPGGAFVTSFGDGLFCPRPHAITAANDGTVWVTDIENHVIRHFTSDGKHLGDLGTSGVPSNTGVDDSIGNYGFRTLTISRAGPPFHDPTCAVVAPNDDLYVSDGYGNAAVHHFSPDGELIRTWGGPGSVSGRFRNPHGITIHHDEVVVCDRENERLQFFGLDGSYHREWAAQRPAKVAFDAAGRALVISMGWNVGEVSFARGMIDTDTELPSCLTILDDKGRLLEQVGGEGQPWEPGTLTAAHGVAIDSKGVVYVADITSSMRLAATLSVPERLARQDAVVRWAYVPLPRELEHAPAVHKLVAT